MVKKIFILFFLVINVSSIQGKEIHWWHTYQTFSSPPTSDYLNFLSLTNTSVADRFPFVHIGYGINDLLKSNSEQFGDINRDLIMIT